MKRAGRTCNTQASKCGWSEVAMKWLEENDNEGYIKHFGTPAEPDGNRKPITLTLDSKLLGLFKAKSEETDIPMSRYIDKAIQAILDDKI